MKNCFHFFEIFKIKINKSKKIHKYFLKIIFQKIYFFKIFGFLFWKFQKIENNFHFFKIFKILKKSLMFFMDGNPSSSSGKNRKSEQKTRKSGDIHRNLKLKPLPMKCFLNMKTVNKLLQVAETSIKKNIQKSKKSTQSCSGPAERTTFKDVQNKKT